MLGVGPASSGAPIVSTLSPVLEKGSKFSKSQDHEDSPTAKTKGRPPGELVGEHLVSDPVGSSEGFLKILVRLVKDEKIFCKQG